REVELDGIEAGGLGAARGVDEVRDHAVDVLWGQRIGGVEAGEGLRGRPHRAPARGELRHRAATAAELRQRGPGGGLAAGMGELDGDLRALALAEGGDPLPGRGLLVVPQTGVLRADAALG